MNPAIAMAMGGGGTAHITDVDSVFSIDLRVGTGASASIISGVNLSANGGMVLTKSRSAATDWTFYDTVRGTTKELICTSAAETTQATGLTAFNTDGHTIGALARMNTSAATYVDVTFSKASRFFDVVTYTGTGVSDRVIAHALGGTPGVVLIKATSTTGEWWFSHRSVESYQAFLLNTTGGAASFGIRASTNSETTFTLEGTNNVAYANTNGVTYVAYLFAHDSTTDGLIQCGSFTTDGSGNASVTLGWEPQFLLVRAATTTGDWIMLDTVRAWNTSTADAKLFVNTTAAETTATEYGEPTATGFNFKGGTASAGYIYMAIRKPNKAPTNGTQVFAAATRTGTGAAAISTAAGFSPDLVITKKRSSTTLTGARFVDRLRGKTIHFDSSAATAEVTTADTITGLDSNTGMSIGADATTSAFNTNTHTYVDLFFKRATGVLDIVCDTGTGAAHTISHNLGVIPELIIRKGRSGATQGEIYCSGLANTEKLVLSSTAAKATDTTSWNSTTPTASVFTVGNGANVNTNAATYVSYLFATLAGVSKVGSYTGNGTSINIDCGFVAGARFVLIKRTDSTGDWFLWDTVRGIVAGNDPHISLNTTAAEVTTDDTIDPLSSGFTVNQLAATNINVNAAAYIFVAIS